jgi:hypothetical protein
MLNRSMPCQPARTVTIAQHQQTALMNEAYTHVSGHSFCQLDYASTGILAASSTYYARMHAMCASQNLRNCPYLWCPT